MGIPVAAAFPFAVSALMIVVSWHPRWRSGLHWGRGRKGPPMSLTGLRMLALLLALFGLGICAEGRYPVAERVIAGCYCAAFVATACVAFADRRSAKRSVQDRVH